MKITVLKRLDKNPYFEGTLSWNIWIDILCACDNDNTTTLEKVCSQNNLPEEYYDFSELINDGLIKIEEV